MVSVFEKPEGSINRIDRHVGERLRLRRRMLGLPQEELAKALEVGVAEFQKYELGHSRITAGALFLLCQKLDVPMAWFFIGYDDGAEHNLAEQASLETRRSELDVLLGRASQPVREQIMLLAQILIEQDEARERLLVHGQQVLGQQGCLD